MKSFFSYKLFLGFVGGVVFIASCGSEYANKAVASSVSDQLFCERLSSTILSHAFVGEVYAAPESLSCIDSSDNAYYRYNLQEIYQLGWRVQLISNGSEYVFIK